MAFYFKEILKMNIKKILFVLLFSSLSFVSYAGELSLSNQHRTCSLLATIVEAAATLRDLGLEQDVTTKLLKSKNTLEDVDMKNMVNYAIDTFVPQVYSNKEASADLLKAVALNGCLK